MNWCNLSLNIMVLSNKKLCLFNVLFGVTTKSSLFVLLEKEGVKSIGTITIED